MYLNQLLNGVSFKIYGEGNPNVTSLSCDTSTIQAGCMFFCFAVCICMYVCMFVCVCIYVCVFVCMYVLCMGVCVCINVCMYLPSQLIILDVNSSDLRIKQ